MARSKSCILRRRLTLLAALATLFTAALSIACVFTQHRDAHFSVRFRKTPYTLHSFASRITLSTPMTSDSSVFQQWVGRGSDEMDSTTPEKLQEARQRVSRIHNADVQWRFDKAEGEFFCDFDKASGSQEALLEHFYNEANGIGSLDGKRGLAALFGPGPETRGNERARLLALIGSLDDRDKIIAVHAILYRLRYNQLELLRTAGFTWNPVETLFGLPFKRDPKTGSLHPDLATGAVLASAWPSAFDQRVFSVSYATLIPLSVLPILLWITRPRRNKPTLRRWLFNVALLLLPHRLRSDPLPRPLSPPPRRVCRRILLHHAQS